MHIPFTTSWADAFRAAINDDAAYRAAAARWTWPVVLALDPAEPAHGYDAPVGVRLALEHGHCHAAELGAPESFDATFVLRADYATWKDVVQGALDPIGAVMAGRIRLTGPLTTLLMHTTAATALLGAARQVPTRFPDEDP